MWAIAKVKIKDLNTFKKNLLEKTNNKIRFYHPKILCHKYKGDKVKKSEKFILENYIFCYSDKFKESNFISEFRFLKGLEYFLQGNLQNQNNIIKFINYCKSCEDEKGYLTQSFFKTIISKKAKFVSGPFTNMIFEIIEKQKNKLKILVGNVITTIPNKKNYLYRPV